MSTDPVPLSDLLTALPDDADFDAVYAELLATRRGRWFLREYSLRHRGAERHSVVRLAAGVEAVAPQVPPAGELGDLTAALGRIEAEIASSATLGRDGFAAIERIQDIAFALRERKVDAALCDVLEAASGELADVLARNDAAAERVQGAIALLRKLIGGIDALIVRAAAAPSTNTEPAAAEETAASAVERPAAEMREDDEFVAAIGALAASLPPSGDQQNQDQLIAADHIPGNETAPDEEAARLHQTADAAVIVAADTPPAEENEIDSMLERAPLNQALPDSQAPTGPEEDPGDLFEPRARASPLLTPPAEAATPAIVMQQTSPAGQPAQAIGAPPPEPNRSPLEPPSPPRDSAMPVTRAVPPPATSDSRDPLAEIHALSEEELIALFS
jgi:hypothetical protein